MFKPTLHSFDLATDGTPHLVVRAMAIEMPVLSPRGLWKVQCLPLAGGNEECLNKAILNEPQRATLGDSAVLNPSRADTGALWMLRSPDRHFKAFFIYEK